MGKRISFLMQCAKAIRDVPHVDGCNAVFLGEGFPCGCYRARDALIGAGLRAAADYAKLHRFAQHSTPDLRDGMLDAFRKATKPGEHLVET
jgi:hypothetical protein